jgi:hypothetical protein
VVRIYFNNGLAFAAMHDYFLEILEPSYEAFGGMAEEQHKFVTNIYASMKMDVRRELRRRDVNVSNFGAFHACHISADKSEVTFVMPTQDRYLVSATELIAWRGQHGSVVPEMNRRGKHAERRECENCPSAFLSTFRYGPEKRAVRMHFTDGIPYDVDWETVLIHCDDRYERYRGPLSGNLEHFNVDMR